MITKGKFQWVGIDDKTDGKKWREVKEEEEKEEKTHSHKTYRFLMKNGQRYF